MLSTVAVHSKDGLFVIPNIPEKKKLNARKSCIIPEDEEILAIVDTTLLGSASNCLVIGQTGIYLRNDWASVSPRRHSIPYSMFYRLGIEPCGFEVCLGGLVFNRSGCTMLRDEIVWLLRDVREVLRDTR